MRRSLRGRRSAALILFVGLSLASVPCGGVGPLAFLAKEIVQGLVRSLIEDALHATLMAALGPCDGALVSGSLSVAQGLAAMRPGGAMPSLPGVPGMPAGQGFPATPFGMPSMPPGMPGLGAMGTAGAIGGMGTSALAGAGMNGLAGAGFDSIVAQMRGAAREMARERRKEQRERGLTPEQIEAEDLEEEQQRREMLAQITQMEQAKPLSAAELDEFIALYARMAPLSGSRSTCSPESLKRMLTLTPVASMPMVAGPLRMVIEGLREADAGFAKARKLYAEMGPEERSEHVALMLAERQQWSEEEDETFVAMLKSDLLGMPPDMRAALERPAR